MLFFPSSFSAEIKTWILVVRNKDCQHLLCFMHIPRFKIKNSVKTEKLVVVKWSRLQKYCLLKILSRSKRLLSASYSFSGLKVITISSNFAFFLIASTIKPHFLRVFYALIPSTTLKIFIFFPHFIVRNQKKRKFTNFVTDW